jgi:hypothetical protein
VGLVRGCNNLVLTWPDGTSLTTVAAALSPADALVAIWRFDAATGRYLGFNPAVAGVSDLTAATQRDAVFICLTGPATLARPAP